MFARWSIKRRLIGAILLTSTAVLLLTSGAFLTYELVTFRQTLAASLTTLARVVAANSTAALAFRNVDDAALVLSALAEEPQVVAAGLYDENGELFAAYPASIDTGALPRRPTPDGYRFNRDRLVLSQAVINGDRRLGTIYLESNVEALRQRLVLYAVVTGAVLLGAFAVAFGLSTRLQRNVSRPVMALAAAAAAVTERHDYAVRAERFADDELGRLTDTFNAMLEHIQSQTSALQAQEEHLRRENAERARVEAEVRVLNAELEQRVQQRTHALEVANKELEAFSYSVSHDLRAPLRAIAGFSQILMEDFLPSLPPEAAGHLRRVANAAQKMGQLIDDLLDFSRLGRAKLTRTAVDPARLVQQVIDDVVSDEERARVTIKVGDLPPCHADPALLKQVYVNLISNAVKFTGRSSSATVEIGCQQTDGESVYFVKDNGAGFDMQYADKLFGVFQRLHRAEDYQGTGVGLAIVHRVITRHGGRVWAQAAINQGACFYFTIGDMT
jgi:light-regulated signal transduction histidine kinase (bacteriophytochrome)